MGYHAGELAVQRRVGKQDLAARLMRGIGDEIPDAAREFLSEQRMLVVASGDAWASLLHGPPGFITAPDDRTVLVAAKPADVAAGPVGLLAIEPATRRRMRVNGTAKLTGSGPSTACRASLTAPHGLRVRTEQVYSNCPKYIVPRRLVAVDDAPAGAPIEGALTDADRALIATVDTFFVATAADGGADASHRGGEPGFVTVDGDRLSWPDYVGNSMFMTLGNLLVNPRIGLLFIDFESGDTLQLAGTAELAFEPRGVQVIVERAVRTPRALPLRFSP